MSSLPALSVDVASGPVFLLAPWEVWVCYKDILGVSQTQVCLVGSTFGLKYRGYRSPKNEKWGCECLRCGGGGQAKLGHVLGDGEEVLGAAHLKQGAGPVPEKAVPLHPATHVGPPGPKAALHGKAKGAARELMASGSVDRGSHLTASEDNLPFHLQVPPCGSTP